MTSLPTTTCTMRSWLKRARRPSSVIFIDARIIEVSRKNLDCLKNHTPSLVTGGALYWAVYLKRNGGWRVTKLMDLRDLLYWDTA